MKKTLILIIGFLVFSFLLSGCTAIRVGSPSTNDNTIKSLGLAYENGKYTINGAFCTGYITTGQTELSIFIQTGKKVLNNQSISVNAVENASLRLNGKYIVANKADLTNYVISAKPKNDGSIIWIRLDNPNKWVGSDGKELINNSTFAGIIDVQFTISDS